MSSAAIASSADIAVVRTVVSKVTGADNAWIEDFHPLKLCLASMKPTGAEKVGAFLVERQGVMTSATAEVPERSSTTPPFRSFRQRLLRIRPIDDLDSRPKSR